MLSAAEIASMTSTVAASLDVTVPRVRTTGVSQDGYGHSTSPTQTTANVTINVIKPTATQLQSYAGIIGSQAALMIRYMPTTDIKEGDTITYMSKSWLVQNTLLAESYTFANDALITTVQ